MIDLYTWTTPNGRKISVMLEEIGLPYKVIPIDISKGAQFTPEFTAVTPNQKIPAIVDHDVAGGPLAIFESGAILIHLAEKSGRLLPRDVRGRAGVLQWLMFQMSHVGPILGQVGHFMSVAPEKIPYAIQRFVTEAVRIFGVLDRGLTGRDFLAGEYSIADIATYPWVIAALGQFEAMMPERAAEFRNLRPWVDRVEARPAVKRGMAVPKVG
jgi:GST-like protein